METKFGEGKVEERRKLAKAFRDNGVAIAIIAKTTGLSEEEIINL